MYDGTNLRLSVATSSSSLSAFFAVLIYKPKLTGGSGSQEISGLKALAADHVSRSMLKRCVKKRRKMLLLCALKLVSSGRLPMRPTALLRRLLSIPLKLRRSSIPFRSHFIRRHRLDLRVVLDSPLLFDEFRGKRFMLLWRGSRDSFGARDFHGRCDGRVNILTLILDTAGMSLMASHLCLGHQEVGVAKAITESKKWDEDRGKAAMVFNSLIGIQIFVAKRFEC
jgi:hypothetical protein